MPASMTIDQAGLPAGVADFARTDGLATGALVTLTSVGGGATHRFELLWVPPEDTTALASLTQTGPTTWTFTPDVGVYGTYRILLVVNEGTASESRQTLAFVIRTPVQGLIIPAANEVADPTVTRATASATTIRRSEQNEPFGPFATGSSWGWWRALRDLTMAVDAGGGGGKRTFRIVVGNALNGDTLAECDYLDPGDGSGIEAALAAAALEPVPPEVFLRDGSYGPGLAPPFSVPASVRVFGASQASVQVNGSPDVRQVFALGSGASLDTMAIVVPAGNPGSMSGTEVVSGSDGTVRDLFVLGAFMSAAEPTETLTAFIRMSGGFVGEVSGCILIGVSRATNGLPPLAAIDATTACEIDGNRIVGFDRGVVLTSGTVATVRGNVIIGCVVDGVLLDGCVNCTAKGNTLEVGPSGAWTGPSPGVHVTGSSSNNAISGNTISGSSVGTVAVLLESATSRNVVSGNAIGERIVSDLGTDNNVEVNQLPWRLNVATATQFTSGGTAPDATPPLIPASRARVTGTSSVGAMLALDAFDITTDLGGPFTLTFAGGEATPQDICDRINAEWQTASGIPSGPTAWIAFVDGVDRGRIFIESPTRDPLGSGTVSIVDNVAGTLTRMGFVSPGPIAAAGTAQSQPPFFGTFPRRDCTVDFSTFNGLLTALDTFTYENESIAPVVVTLAGAPYANLAALVADINGQVGTNVAHVDPRDPLERFFLSSDLCGSTASQTLTDGVNTPLATMGFTTGALAGVDDTPTLTPGNIPGAWADPGATPDALVFEVNGCSGGVALFLAGASLPATVKKRVTFEGVPGSLGPTGGIVEATNLGYMGMVFNYDPARGVGQIYVASVNGDAIIGMSGTNAAVQPQLPQPGYVLRLEADLDTYLSSIAAGSPYEGCPVTSIDSRLIGVLTVSAPPPAVTADPQIRGLRTYGGPQMPFNGAFGDWYVDPADPPTCNRFGLYFVCFGPTYGPVRWYIRAASVEVRQ